MGKGLGFCNNPNPLRVRSVSAKIFETKWMEFALQLDQIQA